MDNNNSIYLEEIRRIVLSGLQGCNVKMYLFGSVVQGKPGQSSEQQVSVVSHQ